MLFSYLRPKKESEPVTLGEYFRETVFDLANPEGAKKSQFRRIMSTDFHKAEAVAKAIMVTGDTVARNMPFITGERLTSEEGILAVIDRKREDLGLELNRSVYYRAGDANKLWPGLSLKQ